MYIDNLFYFFVGFVERMLMNNKKEYAPKAYSDNNIGINTANFIKFRFS